jgi:hypothetical protein
MKQYEKKILELRKDYDDKINKLMNDLQISLADCDSFKKLYENNEKSINELSIHL